MKAIIQTITKSGKPISFPAEVTISHLRAQEIEDLEEARNRTRAQTNIHQEAQITPLAPHRIPFGEENHLSRPTKAQLKQFPIKAATVPKHMTGKWFSIEANHLIGSARIMRIVK